MLESIIKQDGISFKELEQKIFRRICELGRQMTRTILDHAITGDGYKNLLMAGATKPEKNCQRLLDTA